MVVVMNPEQIYGVSNIKSHIPVMLDIEESNYDAWRELFLTHCLSFDVMGHIDGTLLPTNANDVNWQKRDGIVKLSLYGTLTPKQFQGSFVTGSTSRDIWLRIKNQFRNNKDARALRLDSELRTKDIGDMRVADYYRKMKKLADSLRNVDVPVTDRNLVMYVLNGLNPKFDNIINVIKHRQPFPSFDDAATMLQEEEDRLKRAIKPNPTHVDHSFSSTVLACSEAPPVTNFQRSGGNQMGYRGRGRGNNIFRGRGGRFSYYNMPTFNSWNRPPFYQNPYQMWNHPWGYPPYVNTNGGNGLGLLGPRPAY
ncbi:hypothetical protein AtEden1_Chr1g0037861 [Arabidopsis thaliana]